MTDHKKTPHEIRETVEEAIAEAQQGNFTPLLDLSRRRPRIYPRQRRSRRPVDGIDAQARSWLVDGQKN
jgi:hypothetical protein